MVAVNTLAPMAEIREVTTHSESGSAQRKKTAYWWSRYLKGGKKEKKVSERDQELKENIWKQTNKNKQKNKQKTCPTKRS